VTIEVRVSEKLKELISQVPATLADHGSKMVGRGQVIKVLNGYFVNRVRLFLNFLTQSLLMFYSLRTLTKN